MASSPSRDVVEPVVDLALTPGPRVVMTTSPGSSSTSRISSGAPAEARFMDGLALVAAREGEA